MAYDAAECQRKKSRMREMFNETVTDGESYDILHATQTSTKFEHGFVFDTNTTSFYHYILGYRKSDSKVVLVQIDRDLTQHSDAFYVEMDAVVGASYNPKYHQACLLYKKGYPGYAEILDVGDTGSKTMYGIPNTVQMQEREAFLDFLEQLRSRREQEGHKQEKWKR